jgi:hypothetical protein
VRRAWPGLVKVKMLHRVGGTILLPEVIVVGSAGTQWAQPQWVYAPILGFGDDEDDALATIQVAVADPLRQQQDGLLCTVTLARRDLVLTAADGSQLYRCQVTTDHSPAQLAVGRARRHPDRGLEVRLFHHTSRDFLAAIQASGHLRGSAWNYQGTRKLANVAYAYFTSLRSIGTEDDLQSIAMASRGKLALRLDSNSGGLAPDLVLDVYRASTRDRKATLPLWVTCDAISTPHIWQHAGPPVVYEIAHPWIFRVGLHPGAVLDFAAGVAIPDPAVLRRFDYAVIGDCTAVSGLKAPFEEEDTTHTFAVQDLSGTDVFTFWRSHANSMLHRDPSDPQHFLP